MKKRLLALGISLIFTVSALSGCGLKDLRQVYDALQEASGQTAKEETSETQTAGPSADATQTESTQAVTESAEESLQETESIEGAEDDKVTPIHFRIEWEGDWLNDPDLEDTDYAYLTLAYIEYRELTLLDDEKGRYGSTAFPRLQETLEDYNQYRAADVESYGQNLVQAARTEFDDVMETGEYDSINIGELAFSERYYDTANVRVTRSDSLAFSFYEDIESFSGGAHPWNKFYGVTIDPETGDLVELSDVVQDTSVLANDITEAFYDQYPDAADMIIVDSVKDTILEELEEKSLQWILDPYGITFLFSPYELSAYAAGSQFVSLPYVRYSYNLTPGYFHMNEKLLPDKFGVVLEENLMNKIFQSDGSVIYAGTYAEYDPEYDQISKVTVVHDRSKMELQVSDFWSYEYIPYMVCYNGEIYYYLEFLPEYEGLGTTVILKVTDSGIKRLETCTDTLNSNVPSDPDHIRMEHWFDLLSSYMGYKTYHIGAGGVPVSDEELYIADHRYYEFTIRTRKEVTALKLDDPEDTEGEQATIMRGTELVIYRTDGEKIVDLKDKNGTIYRVSVEYAPDSVWAQSINGENIEDLFDGLEFGG